MHYKNGREARVGDRIVGRDSCGNPIAGVVVNADSTNTTCNLQVSPIGNINYATAGECVHVDDLAGVSQPEAEAVKAG